MRAVKNSIIFLFLIFTGSSFIQCSFGDILERIPEAERQSISLKLNIVPGAERFIAAKACSMKNINAIKDKLAWLNGTGLIEKNLIDSAQQALAEEVKELELGEKLVKEKSNERIKTLESDAIDILRRHSSVAGDAESFDGAEIETIKKWLLTCAIWGSACAKEARRLVEWDRSAVVRLQKNPELLRKLSGEVKVFVWPEDLNFPYFLGTGRNFARSKQEMRAVLSLIRNDDSKCSDFDLEIGERLELFDKFLDLQSPFELDLRLRALVRVVDTLIQGKRGRDGVLSDSERQLLRLWLFAYQMLYARDWLSRSGRFVKPWPESSTPPAAGFRIPTLMDYRGYFGGGESNDEAIEAETVTEARIDAAALKPKNSGVFGGWLSRRKSEKSEGQSSQNKPDSQKVSNYVSSNYVGSFFKQSKDKLTKVEKNPETTNTTNTSDKEKKKRFFGFF